MKKYIPAAVCFLLCLGINLYYRSYPVFFPQFKDQAAQTVNAEVDRKVVKQLDQQYPGLSHLAKARLFAKALADYRKAHGREILQQTRQEYDRLRDPFQDKHGQTYLMELDCWHWARYVENIDRHGYPGDTVRDGAQIDTYMLFPVGSPLMWNRFFYYSSWFCYRIFSLFHPVPIFTFLFYLPLFYLALFIAVLYVFCYRHWGNIAALIACLFAGLSPIFIPRSSAGWFDMDVLSLIFPVLIIAAYLSAYQAATLRKQAAWMVLAAFWLGLFCATWIAWGFILFILAAYEAIGMANAVSEKIQYKEPLRPYMKYHTLLPAVFLIAGAGWIILFSGTQPLQTLYAVLRESLVLNKPLTASVWPNVLSTVGELRVVNYAGVVKTQGGLFLFLAALVSMLAVFLKCAHSRDIKRELAVMLVIWFMTMFFFSSHGVRFTMFLNVPLGIFLGWGVAEANGFLSSRQYKQFTLPALGLLTLAAVLTMTANAQRISEATLPLMDDAWYRVLTNIRENTPENATVNSWWDFGDWFKVVARRPVIFDGQSQNTPQAYWMARVLLTSSEEEAVAVLRMLNNGGNKAFETIDAHVRDPFLSIALVKRLLVTPRGKAEALLSSYLPEAAAAEVARIMYDVPDHAAYFVVDASLAGKMAAVSFIGNWDFGRLYLARFAHKDDKETMARKLAMFDIDIQDAESALQEYSLLSPNKYAQWVSHRLSISAVALQNKSEDDIVMFSNGYLYNPRQQTVYMFTPAQGRYRKPRSLFLVKNGDITQIDYPDSDMEHAVMLLEDPKGYKLIVLSPELARSVFVRLFFLNGAGLKHFRLFTETSRDEQHIGVFEVAWPEKDTYGSR